MISRSRGYLPHQELPQSIYFVTFRLDDSLPADVLFRWKQELQANKNRSKPDETELRKVEHDYHWKIEKHLDLGNGSCWLKNPEIAALVSNALRYFDRQRYSLYTWTIMPNHVHVLFGILDSNLESIIHSWKSYTAHEANRLLQRSGRFWQPEYFDRLIKSERQFEYCVRYVLNNPVKAGLCKEVNQWPWSGCSGDIHDLVKRFF